MSVANAVMNAVVQAILLGLIPFGWWLATARSKASFFQWIGIKKPQVADGARFWLFFVGSTAVFCGIGLILVPLLVNGESTAVAQFAGKGFSALVPALLFAFVQTGLGEEVFFRGFLGKRLGERFGFRTGNFLQALLFGLLHGVMFVGESGVLAAMAITILTGTIGGLMGYMNEELAQGSIVPSWLMHGISNLLSALVVM